VKVYCEKTGRKAVRRKDRDTGEESYFATPPGTQKHLKVNAKRFPTPDDLGYFLATHPGWKVYVGDAQINSGIIVEGQLKLAKLKKSMEL
jgi:hypothetical protein